MSWLSDVTESLAAVSGLDRDLLSPTPDEIRTLLDCARIASHTSGERINAPLLCYVLGLMAGRGVGLDLSAPPILARDSNE